MALVITSKVLVALQAELDKHQVDRMRAWLIAADWNEYAAVEALTADEVRAAYAELDTDIELKGEDYETLDELNGVIGGLELAMKVVRDVEQG